ncbi:MutS2 family protein [Selenomonas sp. oral taxon 892 str. F0426]|uniref:endonuclease MutS2 n=1 Tax=Selenomonas sp. oral taxon 892 TaxID=1321785 RepID=UPI0003AD6097|nr:endonuclease MutS2 [Selenomonas sp. oral taxon 892]ERJ92835.1 MutS2 family protein [Selenomonas sp. oral taxon 892 str. F0426]
MDTESFKVLEYGKIANWLAAFAASVQGKERCRSVVPSGDYDEVVRLHQETAEAVQILQVQAPPFGGVYDLRDILKAAARGSILEIDELRSVMSTMGGMRNVKYFFRDLTLDVPLLKEQAKPIEILGMVERHLKDTIDEHGNFRDDASPELRRITRELHTAQAHVKDRLSAILHDAANQKYFQEAIVTVRDERYVIPVKQEYRNYFPGVIHDQSASGATLFIEPLATVELNNTVRQMALAREQEIQRILQKLSAEIAVNGSILAANCEILAAIDLIFARAGLAREMEAYPPTLNRDGYVHLKRARHPLLPKDKVVPIDIELGKTFSILLVTGPNTGGKTVSMKTLGLLALLSQIGCFLPTAPNSELPVYRNIYADIGDEQSIEQSLSTFSAHTRNIVRIIEKAEEGDLILLDEVGAGTDPDEGAALARSIIEHFLRRNISVVATTHYAALKTYAYTQAGVENASVEFDMKTLRPTYRLLIGIPGASNAFSISRQLGLPQDIVARAEIYVNEEHTHFERIVNELEQEKKDYEARNRALHNRESEITAIETRLRSEREALTASRQELLHKAREEANNIVREARRSAEETIKSLKEQFDDHGMKERRKAIQDARNRLDEAYVQGGLPKNEVVGDPVRPNSIQVGDIVYIKSLAQEGTVLAVQDNELTIQVGGLRTIVKMNACTFVGRKKHKKSTKVHVGTSISRKSAEIRPQIDVRGMTVLEAEDVIGKFIDDAVFTGLSKILVIHGKGTGALRQGLQKYLKQHRYVLSFSFADISEGGTGATVVELK